MGVEKTLKVYTVPVGASMRDSFARELKQLPYGEGVLVLPTGLLQEKLTRTYNVPVSGFDTLANKILNLNGYRALREITRRGQELLVEELIDYYTECGKIKYFSALKEKQGFVKQMTSLLGQLSRSGATADEISNTLNSWERKGKARQKDQEIALIYSGYRIMLKEQGQYDLEGKYRLALKILKEQEEPQLPWSKIYVSDFATLDPLQLELLIALAQHCSVQLGICYEGDKAVCQASKNTVARLTKAVLPEVVRGEIPERNSKLQALVDNIGLLQVAKQQLVGGREIVIREYKSQRDEIEGVLTEIKEQLLAGANIKDFAIGMRSLNDYNGLRLVADAYGIPITLPRVEQLLVQPLTEFLQQLLTAVQDTRIGAEAYFNLLSSSLGKLLFTETLENKELLQQKTYFFRRSQVQQALGYETSEAMPELLQKIDGFIGNCTLVNTVQGYTELLEAFLSDLQLAKKIGALYQEHKLSLKGLQAILATERELQKCFHSLRLDYLASGKEKVKYTLVEFCHLWQEALQEMSLVILHGRKDGLLVNDVVQLQGASLKKVYLLGMREEIFPAGNRENWLYNDKERGELQALGIDLPNTYASYAEENCLFAGALATATEQLCLSFYKDEEGEGSPYLDDVKNIYTDLGIEKIEQKQRASVSEALEQSSCYEEQWVQEQVGVTTLQAATADKERQGVYNGVLEDKGLINKVQSATHYSFSASALENYVDCPFKYLGTKLWQQENTGLRDEQVDGKTRGDLIHNTLARFVNSYLNSKPVGQFEELWQQLLECFEAEIEACVSKGEIYANELWEAERERIKHQLSWWLVFELQEQSQWSGFKPVGLEQEFGQKDSSIKLMTASGLPMYLKGRIDRLDASEEAAFITDYKSGEAPTDKDFANNKDLQMAFYLLAATKLYPEKKILGGNYISFKEHKRQGGVAWTSTGNSNIKVAGKKSGPDYASWEELQEKCATMLVEPVDNLYKGNFAVAPSSKDACKYCSLKDICRKDVLQKDLKAMKEATQDE
ncbi:MAG: PD-(D/E)XK nuclease family protein [Phascolarctobacterium sp.]|nr:PD-(D/E)XK nuclease family protein [Phascolarctobacterium sp.]